MITLDETVVAKLVNEYYLTWTSSVKAKDAMIREAARDKTSLPNNFWHDEYHAREKYRAALRLLETLQT
jgi:hypothetical protein